MIKTSAKAKADIIKFQTYTADNITTKMAPRYWNHKLDTDKGGTQYDTFKRLDSLPKETYYKMIELCKKEGIVFCSTPFDLDSADFLIKLDIDIFKISSSDITYHQLIKKVAVTQKPIILSTGASSINEIKEAVSIILKTGNNKIILQHCILSYPCKIENANLVKMKILMDFFPDFPIGYSDHTIGDIASCAAVAMGAKTIEKHYTLDKKMPDSPDHSFSLSPNELRDMVFKIREIEKTFGNFMDGYYPSEKKAYLYARKSLVSKTNIPKETIITKDMITCKRPGTGIAPKYFNEIIGKKTNIDIKEDTTITRNMICEDHDEKNCVQS